MRFAPFQFAFALLLVAFVVAAPQNVGRETNADRFARGLPPLPPVRRTADTTQGHHPGPSGYPGHGGGQCSSGPVQCCRSVVSSSSGLVAGILKLLGIKLPHDTQIGLTCSPISLLGGGHNTCSAQTVCCDNNSYNGIISVGCSPIKL